MGASLIEGPRPPPMPPLVGGCPWSVPGPVRLEGDWLDPLATRAKVNNLLVPRACSHQKMSFAGGQVKGWAGRGPGLKGASTWLRRLIYFILFLLYSPSQRPTLEEVFFFSSSPGDPTLDCGLAVQEKSPG